MLYFVAMTATRGSLIYVLVTAQSVYLGMSADTLFNIRSLIPGRSRPSLVSGRCTGIALLSGNGRHFDKAHKHVDVI